MKIEDALKVIENFDKKEIKGADAFNMLALFFAHLGTQYLNYSPEKFFEFSHLFKKVACRFDNCVYSFTILSYNINLIKFLIINELIDDKVIEEMRFIVNSDTYNNEKSIETFLKVDEFYNDFLFKVKLNEELKEEIEVKKTKKRRM